MPLFSRLLGNLLPLLLIGVLPAALRAQQTPPQTIPEGPGSSSSSSSSSQAGPQQAAPAAPKAASLMDPAGPTVSLETNEAMFDMAVALNACGYDTGVDESDPVRKRVRDEVNQATVGSARARDDRDKLCLFIDQHRLDDPGRTLAQYISLALFLTPPPQMTPSVEQEDLPPDAAGVELILPLLRKFADDAELHVIWVENHVAYEDMENRLHTPLSQMIVSTNYYLKVPASTGSGRRFLVVLEPMLSPEETNARVYGQDYVVVASPKDGQIRMQLVRHAYLHYEIEPLLFQREDSLDRLLPLLKAVDDAPLQFTFKSDIVALVIESMIRAIEARTMETGVEVAKIPPGLTHSAAEPYERARAASLEKIAAIKQKNVDHSMAQGYVLAQYFYDQLIDFEKNPEGLDEAIGPMVYGMDMATEVHRAKKLTFDAHGEDDPMSRAPVALKGLDQAELKLMKGDVAGAGAIAQQALDSHTGDAGQADFILARVALMKGKIDDAEAAFKDALTASKTPRTLAWSHIYLGRIFDVEEQRDDALTEYKAALTVRDGQPDTKEAAETGIKTPFTLPQRAHPADGSDPEAAVPDGTPPAAPPATAPTPNPQPNSR
jgi:tetratricopeptide (TPR) repeat protein